MASPPPPLNLMEIHRLLQKLLGGTVRQNGELINFIFLIKESRMTRMKEVQKYKRMEIKTGNMSQTKNVKTQKRNTHTKIYEEGPQLVLPGPGNSTSVRPQSREY
jgi:hypothetical protein